MMKYYSLYLFLLIVFLQCFSVYVVSGQSTKYVILISLDGSRPEFYMDSKWPTPNLQKMKKEGIYASEGIETIFPSLTWPAHTSMITGANPDKHGIYYNKPPNGLLGQGYWYHSYIHTPTIFEAVRSAGLTSSAIWWPVMIGGPVDYNFPVRRPEMNEKVDQLTLRLPYVRPDDLLKDFEKAIGRSISIDDLSFENNAQGKFVTNLANFIIQEHKPNLLALHIGELDHAQHSHGTDSPELRSALKFVDSLVGSVLTTLNDVGIMDSTTVIITGDHGHTNTLATFSPNVYLKKYGFISELCWKAKFIPSGGSAFLELNEGVENSVIDSIVSVLKSTPEYKNGIFEILTREKLNKMGANPNALIALDMREGVVVNNKIEGKVLTNYMKPLKSTHGYNPKYSSMNSAFVAVGSGVKRPKDIKHMKIVDIAPYIATLLGIEFEAPDGRVVDDVFD